MNNKRFVILIGNIGSGKSTLSKKYVNDGYYVISRDALRYMIGSGDYIFNEKLEPTIRRGTLRLLEEFFKDNIDVVYDEVNICKSLRKPTIELAQKYNYQIIAVVLPYVSKTKSVTRRLKNPHGKSARDIWNQVWTNFNRLYEEPTSDEGINSIVKL